MASSLLHQHLHELSVFEAAARAGSFSAAGRELGMTQSAVSHHVATLEAVLGFRLFTRVWRGVALTDPGTVLFDGMKNGLSAIGAGIEGARAAARQRQFTVVTDFAFASFWLVARLAELRRLSGGADASIVTSQASAAVDLSIGDVAVTFGVPAPKGWEVTRLVDEEVVPVVSPQLAARQALFAADGAARVPLLHLETPGRDRWLSWPDYFGLAGLAPAPAGADLSFNNYPLLIQAAIAGQGVALGWRPLVDDLIERGLLVPTLGTVRNRSRGYDLLVPPRGQANPVIRAFKRWLQAEFGQLAPLETMAIIG